MIESLRALFSLKSDMGQKGFLGLGTLGTIAILGLASVLGISFAASIEWKFILAVMAMAVIGIGVAGAVFFGVDFQWVIILSIISLSVVVFIQIGVVAAAGLAVIGIGGYRFSGQRPLLMAGLIGIGLLTVIAGNYFMINSGQIEELMLGGQELLGFEVMP